MGCFLIHFHGDTESVDGAVPCKSFADKFMAFFMGNQIVKLQAHPFENSRSGMDADGIIIVKRAVISGADFNNRVHIAVFLYLAIGIGGIAHQ